MRIPLSLQPEDTHARSKNAFKTQEIDSVGSLSVLSLIQKLQVLLRMNSMNLTSKSSQWKKVLERDKRVDGQFVYGVRSTRIYCRPSCPSRRPKPENVVFFENIESARKEGYRACLRCHPDHANGNSSHIKLVAQVCQFIEENDQPPSLSSLAEQFKLSPYHLQRTFKKVAGITPRQYADELRLKRLKGQLKKGAQVTNAIYDSGYGSSSSLYEQATERLGMTPVNYKSGAAELRVTFSTVRSPLGWLLIGKTDKGICALSLGDSPNELIDWLHEEFPKANVTRDDADSQKYVASVLKYLQGEQPHCDLPLDVRATAFQRMVWEELKRIPYGAIRSYSEVAKAIGKPSAVRAVAHACATNPVSIVVPCHRVLRKGGNLGGYRWGLRRKEALLQMEKNRKP
jgi:AraC family transcriptional regulator, regulatory protein of adaptative response / methylated-DNA-[protein]-cysteine methyltransferase